MGNFEELPEQIEGYIRKRLLTDDFVVIEYSKALLMPRHAVNMPRLHKLVPTNLLYEVKSVSEEDAVEQMKSRIVLNDQIKEVDFYNTIKVKIDSTLKEPLQGYDFFKKTFDCYVIVDPESLSRFYAIVTTNLNQDISDLPRLLNQIEDNLDLNPVIQNLEPGNKELLSESFFSKLVHIYAHSEIRDKEKIKSKFKSQNGWNTVIKDAKYFQQNSDDVFKRLRNRHLFCENKNVDLLNNTKLPNTKFVKERDSYSIFQAVRTQDMECLRDRDYLSDIERIRLKRYYPNYHILEYYCLENYLYHPENLEELNLNGFNKQNYQIEISEQKNEALDSIKLKLIPSRNSYPELKYQEITKGEKYESNIISDLNSDEFNRFYKYFDMKSIFNKSMLESFNISQEELSKTEWFKNQIQQLLEKEEY